jgi:hypothetical protein
MSEHPCPAHGCKQMVPNAKLACPQHWALVTKPTQQRVYQTYRARQRLRTAETMLAHYRAMEAAELEMNSAISGGES